MGLLISMNDHKSADSFDWGLQTNFTNKLINLQTDS